MIAKSILDGVSKYTKHEPMQLCENLRVPKLDDTSHAPFNLILTHFLNKVHTIHMACFRKIHSADILI